jgi:hypothetical protein
MERIPFEHAAAARLQGQTSGKQFESAVTAFLGKTLSLLQPIRPADWIVENVGGSRGHYHLSSYVPYRHLDELALAVKENEALRTVLGNSYNISPDVLILRSPISDSKINEFARVVDDEVARRTPIRSTNQEHPIVHAVVSCKWTLRSDRAQNARSEALGLLRNRKGRAPHISVVTGEPTPSRIASLALGTGDIDTIYHFALPELIDAVNESENDEAFSMLATLVDGERLRDIADLPLDLVA